MPIADGLARVCSAADGGYEQLSRRRRDRQLASSILGQAGAAADAVKEHFPEPAELALAAAATSG
jgi:hypothetical protein